MLYLSIVDHTTFVKVLPKKSEYMINEELECSADGNPAPTITWSVNEEEATMKHGQGWKIVTIPKAWSQLEQTLTCTAYNALDGLQSTVFEEDITIQVSCKYTILGIIS